MQFTNIQEISLSIRCEVCIDSVESALEAELGGASRVELCSNLFEGGTTPSYGMIKQIKKSLTKCQLMVMIRPRGGDFCYSKEELEVMKEDIKVCHDLGVDGVVFGILTANGDIDTDNTRELIQLARPMLVTFHRAFDMTNDPFIALEDLIQLGVDRVLTSGQESSCLEGLDLLTELVERAQNRIIILPGGGITEKNIQRILGTCHAQEFHVSGRTNRDSKMIYRNTRCPMGGALRPSEFSLSIVDHNKVNGFISKANQS